MIPSAFLHRVIIIGNFTAETARVGLPPNRFVDAAERLRDQLFARKRKRPGWVKSVVPAG